MAGGQPRKEQRHIVPSVSKLDESGLALLQETLLHHEAFKLAQMLQGENVPASIADLQERFSRDSREAFQFYIFFLLGFMSGIAGGLGSKFMTARNADAVINGICMLQRLLDAKPLGIYWGYLNARAESLGWPCASAEDFALDRDGYVALRQAWCTCGQQERARLLEHFLADGITERALVLEFLPDCISGAKSNKLVGLAVFLHVLVDLLANLSVALNSAPAMGGKKLIRVDLSDMSAFTVAVQNGFVFRTCISRCNFYVGDDKVQVQMTSENWSRTQDSETDITNLSHSMREVLLQQQAVMGHFSIEQAQPWFLSSTIPKNGVMEVSC